MLSEFLDWGGTTRSELSRNGFNVSLISNDATANPSARLDIETDNVVARITAWNSGDVDLEIINIESEATVYAVQLQLAAPYNFDDEFRQFFSVLKDERGC